RWNANEHVADADVTFQKSPYRTSLGKVMKKTVRHVRMPKGGECLAAERNITCGTLTDLQTPASYSILPVRLGERDQGTSFDGTDLQSSAAVLSNEDPRWFQRPVHPVAGWQGYGTTRRRSMNCVAIRITSGPCGSTDATPANPSECLQGERTEIR